MKRPLVLYYLGCFFGGTAVIIIDMEQWQDQAIVLTARAHGESGAVVSLLTEGYGRHAGYVRGAQSSRLRGLLQPGSVVHAHWQARNTDNLGTFKLEQERHPAASFMGEPEKLGALMAACSLCDAAMPEREAHPGVYQGLLALMAAMDQPAWGAVYVMWELAFLRELGFGIELSRCAGGGDPATLCYVSPKSGHAVSAAAGAPYKDRLLPLPVFLQPERGPATEEEIIKGLRLTGHFLQQWVFAHDTRGVPEERLRFERRFVKYGDRQGSPDKEEEDVAHGTG